MSWLVHFFKGRQIKKQVKARIEAWVVSERLKEAFPAGALSIKP